ncbi:MAG: hypothetical protein KF726_04595 [Anaerolineae bacterium]|nr:hypothetical protein [Anaerolineae bacterium]
MRNLSLSRLFAAFRLELRLLCLTWVYPLLHVGWLAMLYASLGSQRGLTAEYLLEGSLRLVTQTMITAVTLFVAGASAARSVRAKFEALEESFPTSAEVTLGRWLACTLAIVAFVVEPLIIAWLVGPAGSFFASAPLFVLRCGILFGFATALTWLLLGLLGPRRWLYPILAAGWVGMLIVPNMLMGMKLPFAQLLNFSGNGSPPLYSEIFGAGISGDLPSWFYLFYASLLVAVISWIALRQIQRRFRRLSPLAALASVAAIALALFAGIGYSSTVAEAQAQDAEKLSAYQQKHESFILPADAPEAITTYDLTVDLSDLASPQFHALLTIRNRTDAALASLPLTLHHDLQITQANLPYTRDGDFLTITPPDPLQSGAELQLELTYRSALWNTDLYGTIPVAQDFIKEFGVSLSFNIAWYPLPGHFVAGFYTPASFLGDGASHFRLTILGADQMTFASNLPLTAERTFEADSAQWAMLVGSPRMVRKEVGEITVYAARDDATVSVTVEQLYPPLIESVRHLFPNGGFKHVIILATGTSPLIPQGRQITDGWVLIPTTPSFLQTLDQRYNDLFDRAELFVSPIVAGFWPGSQLTGIVDSWGTTSGRPATDRSILLNGISIYVEAYRRTNGDAAAMKAAVIAAQEEQKKHPTFTYYAPGSEPTVAFTADQVALALIDLYQAQGDAGVVKALAQVQAHESDVLALTPEALFGWLQEAAHAN